jgi:sugar/nucleoside kinase (ribokinase family)
MHGRLKDGSTPGTLGVIGNISRDLAVHPGKGATWMLGGAALHVALAAAHAGLPASPVAVIGTDLNPIADDPRLDEVDLSRVKLIPGASCAFRLAYDHDGGLISTEASFGVAEALTLHALDALAIPSSCWAWHVCCRRPLAAPLILARLAATGVPFSADFHLASAGTVMPAVRTVLPQTAAVFVNAAEFAVLAQVLDPGELPLVVVSDGHRPATAMRYGQVAARAAPPAVKVTEVTGAGDTLTGTFLAAAARGLGDGDALRAAVSAATAAVAKPGLAIPAGGG